MLSKNTVKKIIAYESRLVLKRRDRVFAIFFISFILCLISFVWINSYIQQEIYIPHSGNVYVSDYSLERRENGSFKYPFKNISSAVQFVRKNKDFKRIFISRGIYKEKLEIDIPLQLIGVEEGVVIRNPEGGSGKTLYIEDELLISNLEVQSGRYAVYISSNGKADILNSDISKAKRYGIYNEIRENINNNPSIRIIGSNIHSNGRQGLYLQKANVLVSNSIINRNGEEGVDLHIDMIAEVRDNRIYMNGEGGLESEIGTNKFNIVNNVIYSNGSSGINMQSYSGDAKIRISSNKVFSNIDHGLRCAIHSNISRGYFQRYLEYSEENIFLNNGLSDIDINCNF